MTNFADMMTLLLEPAIIFLVFLFIYFRAKSYLLYFQQEEYDSLRIIPWFFRHKAYDKRTSLAILVGFGITLLAQGEHAPLAATMIVAFGLLWGTSLSQQHLKHAKKPLVMTVRAKKILGTTLLLVAGLGLAISFVTSLSVWSKYALMILAVQTPLLFLLLANLLLSPFEARTKSRFLSEAKSKLAQLNPVIIGITGSYGKTSTKHILAHILSAHAPTLATPGSVNTEMGITRIIRESLTDNHKYFIVEMGAYGIGSIARLCALTPPNYGIITSIGVAHFERFKSVASVFTAKFELANAVKTNGGKTMVNASAMPRELLEAQMGSLAPSITTLNVADDPATCNARLEDVAATPDGLSFTLYSEKTQNSTAYKVPIFGSHQAANIALAILVAQELGVPDAIIKAALATLPQTRHRLEYHKSTLGPSVLDDAYNSNPIGFREALTTLDILTKDGDGRAILITPGMIELGDNHDQAHFELGRQAGSIAKIAAIVTPTRIPTFIEGFKETMTDDTLLMEFDTQEEAETWVKSTARKDDVILFENNLPDLFERQIRF